MFEIITLEFVKNKLIVTVIFAMGSAFSENTLPGPRALDKVCYKMCHSALH